jgi:hypothetical protein
MTVKKNYKSIERWHFIRNYWTLFVTWIVSGIGYSQSIQANDRSGKTLNLIALILSGAAAIFYFIFTLTY